MKIMAAVSIAFVMMIGVTGCGSDDDVQVESRVKNAAPEAAEAPEAPEASGASGAPSEADCDRLDRLDSLDLRDLRDSLDELIFLIDGRLDSLDRFGLRDLLVDFRYDIRDLLSRCAAASESGADAPEGDDVDGG